MSFHPPRTDTTADISYNRVTLRRSGIELSTIAWRRSNRSPGLAPIDVLRTVQSQLEFEQSDEGLRSNENAKALAQVMQVVAILEGRDATHDGYPVLGSSNE